MIVNYPQYPSNRIDSGLVAKLSFALLGILLSIVGISYMSGRGSLYLDSLPVEGSSVEIGAVDGTTETISVEAESLSKALKKGSYTLSVRSGSASEFINFTIGGFFSTTKISATLKEEDPREFVAENPRSCVHKKADAYLSYSCNGPIEGLVYHVPANENVPTWTSKIVLSSVRGAPDENETTASAATAGNIEDVFDLSDKTYALVYKVDDYGIFHDIYELTVEGTSVRARFVQTILGLGKATYEVRTNNQEITLVDHDSSTIFGGQNFSELSKKYENDDTTPLQAFDASEDGSSYLFLSSLTGKGGKDFEVNATGSFLRVTSGETERTLTLEDKVATRAAFCGIKVCVLDKNKVLSIYDSALDLTATIGNVSDFLYTTDGLYLLRNGEVLVYSTDNLTGYASFSSTSYPATGIRSSGNSVFAVINTGKKSHLLLLASGGFLDRSLPKLLENPFIYTISINKSFLFISPELGERAVSENGTYEYDPSLKSIAKKSIAQTLSETGEGLAGFRVNVIGL